nr:hypothetical protein [uncultured Gellertiella sp.]
MAKLAPEATTPADSATADTAFKNFEPAFISLLTFFTFPLSPSLDSRSRVPFYPLFSYKQGRALISVYFAGRRVASATQDFVYRK